MAEVFISIILWLFAVFVSIVVLFGIYAAIALFFYVISK